jgi:hypothetical protein
MRWAQRLASIREMLVHTKSLMGRDHLEGLDVYERIILKWMRVEVCGMQSFDAGWGPMA